MKTLINSLGSVYRDRFKRYLVAALIVLGAVLLFTGQGAERRTPPQGLTIDMFYLPKCPACEEPEAFLQELGNRYPSVTLVLRDAEKPEEATLLSQISPGLFPGVRVMQFPIVVVADQVGFQWQSSETTGKEIETAVQKYLAGERLAPANVRPREEIDLPLLGRIRPLDYSIPALAVILGIIDGFNPCAMWVLVYLMSLIMALKDRSKLWLIVGSFVFASGVLYFLFMTAWLNAFLFVGYSRPITIVIGLIALGAGILFVREFIATKGAMTCEVVDPASRTKTMSAVERIVSSPITVATLVAIVGLAFVVNSIEFVCSSALPAVFTYVLSVSGLSAAQHYGYILLYDFFFMLDDVIIFGWAAILMSSSLGQRYARYSRPVGAAVLLILGAVMLFAPQLLR
ncbi:MAG: glutaredoxin family protein [Chloroflexota bacterium]